MIPDRKLLIAGSALVLCLALVAGIRATPAAVGGFAQCATPAEISEARQEMVRASSTVANLKAQGVADEKIVSKYRRELAVFEDSVVRGTVSASAAVDRAAASVTRASSTLAAADARHKKLASQKNVAGRAAAALAAQDVTKARKALATANATLAKARKSLETAQAKESTERARLAEPLAASARLTALNVELEEAREEFSVAADRYEYLEGRSCGGQEVEVVATFVSSDARLSNPEPQGADEGIFEMTVSLEARGGDAWIIPSRYPTGLPQGDIYPFRTIPDDFLPSFGEYEIVAVDGRRPSDQASSYRIPEGESRMFRLTLPVAHGAAGCADAAVGWEYIRWAYDPSGKEEKLALVDFREFRTDSVPLCSGASTGISAELVSSSVFPVNLADPAIPGSADTYNFRLQYTVTALGQDVYVDRTPNQLSSAGDLSDVEGASWVTNPIDSPVVARGQALSASGSAAGDSQVGFLVRDGESRTFTLAVELEASADTSTGIRLAGINWSPSPEEGVDEKTFAEGLEDFRTERQFLGVI